MNRINPNQQNIQPLPAKNDLRNPLLVGVPSSEVVVAPTPQDGMNAVHLMNGDPEISPRLFIVGPVMKEGSPNYGKYRVLLDPSDTFEPGAVLEQVKRGGKIFYEGQAADRPVGIFHGE